MKTIYQAEDGKQFDSEDECIAHETFIELAKSKAAHNWLMNSYSGQRLLEKYKLTDVGVWEIRGEDPNCDFGGYHHRPHLATVTGQLRDVVDHAVKLERFFTWGAGGDIELLKVESV